MRACAGHSGQFRGVVGCKGTPAVKPTDGRATRPSVLVRAGAIPEEGRLLIRW